jgi:hypothetical protein
MQKKFTILFPTRERTGLLKSLLDSIEQTTHDLNSIEVLVAYDNDDEVTDGFIFGHSRNWIQWIKCSRSLNFSRDYYSRLAHFSCGRWIIICNDDAEFRTLNWDLLAEEALKDQPGIVMGWIEDGLADARHWDLGNYCCFPLIGREGYEALGYIFPETIPTWGADIWLRKLYDSTGAPVVTLPITIFHVNHWNHSRPQDHINKRIQDNQVCYDLNPTYAQINILNEARKRSMAHAV